MLYFFVIPATFWVLLLLLDLVSIECAVEIVFLVARKVTTLLLLRRKKLFFWNVLGVTMMLVQISVIALDFSWKEFIPELFLSFAVIRPGYLFEIELACWISLHWFLIAVCEVEAGVMFPFGLLQSFQSIEAAISIWNVAVIVYGFLCNVWLLTFKMPMSSLYIYVCCLCLCCVNVGNFLPFVSSCNESGCFGPFSA